MASIRREIVVEARPEQVWAVVRDVGAPHKRLAPGSDQGLAIMKPTLERA